MADARDRAEKVEGSAPYLLIIGFIGIAIAYIIFGIAQVKAFEAWLPYIYVSVGAVYLVLSLALVMRIKRIARPDKFYPERYSFDRARKFGNTLQTRFMELLDLIKSNLHYLDKYKIPIIVILAFVAGTFSTSMLSNDFKLQLPLNFSLPNVSFNIKLPQFNQTKQNTTTAAAVKVESRIPVKIEGFSISKSGGNYNVSFSVVDKDSVKVATAGSVSLRFLDKESNILHEENFNIIESDFKSLTYAWLVDSSKLKKSGSSSGTANIKFISSLGVEMSSDTNIEVPMLSPEDIAKTYEAEYQNSAKAVGKTITKYYFEVTLVKIGFFKKLESGIVKTYYRADIKVRNTAAVEDEFKGSTAKLTAAGNAYLPSTESTFKNEKIKGNQIREGYILFKDVPSALSGSMTVKAGTATAIQEVEYIFDV